MPTTRWRVTGSRPSPWTGARRWFINRNVDDVARAGRAAPGQADRTWSSRRTATSPSPTGSPASPCSAGGRRTAAGPSEWTGDTDVPDPAGTGTVRGIELPGSWQATGDDACTELVLAGDGPFDFCRDNTSAASGQPADAPPGGRRFADGFLRHPPGLPGHHGADVRTVGFRDFEPWRVPRRGDHPRDGVTFTRHAEAGVQVFDALGRGRRLQHPARRRGAAADTASRNPPRRSA